MINVIKTAIILCFLSSPVEANLPPENIWKDITFYSEEYPPYNYTEGESIKGIAVVFYGKNSYEGTFILLGRTYIVYSNCCNK